MRNARVTGRVSWITVAIQTACYRNGLSLVVSGLECLLESQLQKAKNWRLTTSLNATGKLSSSNLHLTNRAKAQDCYCGEANCKGLIGGEQKSEMIEYEEEEDYYEIDDDAYAKTAKKGRKKAGNTDDDYDNDKDVSTDSLRVSNFFIATC